MSWQFCKCCLFLLADCFIALTILFAYYEYPRHLLCLDYGTEQPVWLDVTPGSSTTIPLFFEMRYSPLPLPREQNVSAIAGVVLRPGEPVILKGRPNAARFWSFVFYPRECKKHSCDLPSIDAYHVELEPDGSYVVTFSPQKSTKNWVDTGDSTGGIIFMRTYLPLPGSPTRLPAIYFGDRLMTPEEEWHERP
jgi:hypothetical protein